MSIQRKLGTGDSEGESHLVNIDHGWSYYIFKTVPGVFVDLLATNPRTPTLAGMQS